MWYATSYRQWDHYSVVSFSKWETIRRKSFSFHFKSFWFWQKGNGRQQNIVKWFHHAILKRRGAKCDVCLQLWASGMPQAALFLCLWGMIWGNGTVNSSGPHTYHSHTHKDTDSTTVGSNESLFCNCSLLQMCDWISFCFLSKMQEEDKNMSKRRSQKKSIFLSLLLVCFHSIIYPYLYFSSHLLIFFLHL